MGNNLNSGLLQEDYKVTIENDLGKLDCAVTELSNSTLECIYDPTSGRLFSDESTAASVTVIVSEQISCLYIFLECLYFVSVCCFELVVTLLVHCVYMSAQ